MRFILDVRQALAGSQIIMTARMSRRLPCTLGLGDWNGGLTALSPSGLASAAAPRTPDSICRPPPKPSSPHRVRHHQRVFPLTKHVHHPRALRMTSQRDRFFPARPRRPSRSTLAGHKKRPRPWICGPRTALHFLPLPRQIHRPARDCHPKPGARPVVFWAALPNAYRVSSLTYLDRQASAAPGGAPAVPIDPAHPVLQRVLCVKGATYGQLTIGRTHILDRAAIQRCCLGSSCSTLCRKLQSRARRTGQSKRVDE